MLYLKCTGEVQKVLGLRKDQIADALPSQAPLGNWYVHRFEIGANKVFLFMSEVTLLSFVLYQGKKPVTVQTLPNMLMAGLEQLLQMKGLSAVAIEKTLAPYTSGLLAKTDRRKTLGSLNDLVRCYRQMIEFQGGLAQCDLTATIMKINDMPQRTLGWEKSWDVVEAVLTGVGAARH